MRPTFYIDLDCRVHSCNAPKDRPHCFKVADTLWLADAFDYEQGIIPAGTKMFVSHVDQEDGTMWLLAEGDVPALYYADNMVVVMPWVNDDLLMCLRADVRCPEKVVLPGLPLTALEPDCALPLSNVRQVAFPRSTLALVVAGLIAAWALPSPLVRAGLIHNGPVQNHADVGTTIPPTG